MNRGTESRRRGFTLIELLVVIGVIAVLIAILLPSLAKAKETARKVVCQTRIRGWGQAFIMYTDDYNGDLPLDGDDGTSAAPIGLWSDTYLWFNGLTPYMGTGNQTYNQLQLNMIAGGKPLPKGPVNSLFMCPDAEDAGAGSGDIMTSPTGNPPYPAGYFDVVGWRTISPALGGFAQERPMLLCYGMNSQLRQWTVSAVDPPYPGQASTTGTPDCSKFVELKPPGVVPIMVEKRINPNELKSNDPNIQKTLAQSKVTANRFTARHNLGGNIAFADGHVEWFANRTLNTGAGTNKNNNYNIPNVIMWSPLAAP